MCSEFVATLWTRNPEINQRVLVIIILILILLIVLYATHQRQPFVCSQAAVVCQVDSIRFLQQKNMSTYILNIYDALSYDRDCVPL